jgi:hypothetical protein
MLAVPDRILLGAGVGENEVVVSPVVRHACDLNVADRRGLSPNWEARGEEHRQRKGGCR